MGNPKYANRKHKTLRAKYAREIAAGLGECAETICLEPTRAIPPGAEWDLAHNDDGLSYKGAAHKRCNRADGARRGNTMRAAAKRFKRRVL